MIAVDDIVRLYQERKSAAGTAVSRMEELTSAYEGSVVVPLPELDRNERVAVANLIAQGLDQTAMRIASTLPDVYYPPTKPGQDLSERNSRVSRQATLGWWDASQMELKLGRRARWLIGYACSPVTLRWDAKQGCPRWQLRSPLATFPSHGDDPDDMVPDDCLFAFKRSLSWLTGNYPDATRVLSKGADPRPDTMFECVEYTDPDEYVLVVLGRSKDPHDVHGVNGSAPHQELERAPNRAGVPLTYVPGRITLNKRQGAYDGMIGLYQQQAKLMALEVIAVTRGVFPDFWLESEPNQTARIITMANGRRGVVGEIEGGRINTLPINPGYKTEQTVDRLERYMRMNGGVPAEFGGESTTNVRTGRRGDSILSAVVDFPVGEAQMVLARSMMFENQAAVALAKSYAGNTPKSFYVNAKGAKGRVDYTPNKHLVSDANIVTFPAGGTDVNGLVTGIGQRLGVGTISLRTARKLDPMIEDGDAEGEWRVAEQLEAALLAGISQQVQAGTLGPADVAEIADAVRTDRSTLEAAVLAVQARRQTQQATSGAPGSPEGPVPPGSPQAQPGLGGPGAPPQAGTIAPTANEQGLAQLLGALRGGAKGAA